MSWEELGKIGNVKPQTVALTDDEIVIAQIFKGEHGSKALAALARITVEKPSFQTMHSDGVNTAIAMAVREGENNLYRKILLTIKKVDNDGTRQSSRSRPTRKSNN